jgi:hypothetical protein
MLPPWIRKDIVRRRKNNGKKRKNVDCVITTGMD